MKSGMNVAPRVKLHVTGITTCAQLFVFQNVNVQQAWLGITLVNAWRRMNVSKNAQKTWLWRKEFNWFSFFKYRSWRVEINVDSYWSSIRNVGRLFLWQMSHSDWFHFRLIDWTPHSRHSLRGSLVFGESTDIKCWCWLIVYWTNESLHLFQHVYPCTCIY